MQIVLPFLDFFLQRAYSKNIDTENYLMTSVIYFFLLLLFIQYYRLFNEKQVSINPGANILKEKGPKEVSKILYLHEIYKNIL